MPRHERVYENPATGWSDWISPIMKRYQMSCCDCGLVHTVKFRVVRVTRYKGSDRWISTPPLSGFRVQLQVRRDNRATAQTRRWKGTK